MDTTGSSKKLRKPYTITKSRDRWTEDEHERFIDALLLFNRDWKKIEEFVGTKTVIQIRSHAQKYFQKVQASGIMEHMPPPRPKRKVTHPHQQKASNYDRVPLQASMVCPFASSCLLPARTPWNNKSMPMHHSSDEAMSLQDYSPVLPVIKGGYGLMKIASINSQNTCWTGSSSKPLQTYEVSEQGNSHLSYSVIPNFAEVYNLIGSMFDPYIKCPLGVYLQKLKEMDPITAKTVLILVRNLIINMSSPDFEPLPSVYVAESVISSGTAGTSAGAENTAAIAAGLALISIAAASAILLQVGKSAPQVQSLEYSGPPLIYYINKFKPVETVEAPVPPESQSSTTVEASAPPEPQVPSDVQSESNV